MTNIPGAQDPQQEPFRVSGPTDILAFIPHSLGFAPQESLVLMTMNSSRLGATLRLDLPESALDYSEYAATVGRILRSDSAADGVLMALYTDRAWKREGTPPYLRLITQLGECLSTAGLPIRDGWLVSAATWRDYFCTDTGCCPWPGHPLGQISDSSLSAEMVFRGSAYARSLEEAVGQDQPRPWGRGRDAAAHAAAYTQQISGRWCLYPQFAATLAVWDRFFAAAAAGTAAAAGAAGASGGADPAAAAGASAAGASTGGAARTDRVRGCPPLRSDPEAAGFLLASLRARPVRDTLLVMAALGRGRALAGAAACSLLTADDRPPILPPLPAASGPAAGNESPASGTAGAAGARGARGMAAAGADFRAVLVGQYGKAPDWHGMDGASSVFTELLAAASAGGDMDAEADAALLSLLAWMEWARGRGSRAQVYLARCLDSHPDYRLAELLQDLLATGVFPAWAQNPATAWRGAAERYPGTARA